MLAQFAYDCDCWHTVARCQPWKVLRYRCTPSFLQSPSHARLWPPITLNFARPCLRLRLLPRYQHNPAGHRYLDASATPPFLNFKLQVLVLQSFPYWRAKSRTSGAALIIFPLSFLSESYGIPLFITILYHFQP